MICDELKPCPFCGSTAVGVYNTITGPVTNGVHFDEPVAIVICHCCAASAGFIKIKGDVSAEEAMGKAVEYWNMRDDDEEDDDDL